jgi:hypothetical protein
METQPRGTSIPSKRSFASSGPFGSGLIISISPEFKAPAFPWGILCFGTFFPGRITPRTKWVPCFSWQRIGHGVPRRPACSSSPIERVHRASSHAKISSCLALRRSFSCASPGSDRASCFSMPDNYHATPYMSPILCSAFYIAPQAGCSWLQTPTPLGRRKRSSVGFFSHTKSWSRVFLRCHE